MNSSIIRFKEEDELLFGNDNNPKSPVWKLELIKNAFTLEFMSLTFLINSKPLTLAFANPK